MVLVLEIIFMLLIWLKGHIKALNWVLNNNGIDAFNLGTGNGYMCIRTCWSF